ncbi:hypothetical protein YPPY13_4225, partial [Yersinia pestis PY-13]|jgi:hypothetical protein
MAGGI